MYEKWTELRKKYAAVLAAIGKQNEQYGVADPAANDPDPTVALMMLEEMARTGDHEIYAGVPAGFDWAQFQKDYAAAKAE